MQMIVAATACAVLTLIGLYQAPVAPVALGAVAAASLLTYRRARNRS